jgi:hypothetical protein
MNSKLLACAAFAFSVEDFPALVDVDRRARATRYPDVLHGKYFNEFRKSIQNNRIQITLSSKLAGKRGNLQK